VAEYLFASTNSHSSHSSRLALGSVHMPMDLAGPSGTGYDTEPLITHSFYSASALGWVPSDAKKELLVSTESSKFRGSRGIVYQKMKFVFRPQLSGFRVLEIPKRRDGTVEERASAQSGGMN
jgi:hypothetical protein